MKKKYSASLVSRKFWFSEFKIYLQLRKEGFSDEEIKEKNDFENLFLAVSSNRQKEIYQTVKRRINVLDDEVIGFFEFLNVDNQKVINLIAILLLDDLFSEFMTDVYFEKIRKKSLRISAIDYRTFFTEKQRSGEDITQWKEYTIKRLAASYRTNLLEAGLLVNESDGDILTPKIIDKHIIQWLVDQKRQDIVIALGGKL